ncbi:MAG TPA: hypothetical protein VGQ65_06860 [Thermoanaerobaculia bacterium]|nr:hypothetical protein [Thermoanaerobaculia bacterium]
MPRRSFCARWERFLYRSLKLAYRLKVNAGELFVGFSFDVIRKLKL